MVEQYGIIPHQEEWNRLFDAELSHETKVHVYKKKKDVLVLLLYELHKPENGFLITTGGTGRNGLAPIIVRTFVDETGKTLVKKPKDMLAKRMGNRERYKAVWEDVHGILHELERMERNENGRNKN